MRWSTGTPLSEALIFASTNPQYDDRLFIELQVQYMKIPSSNLGRTCCVQKLLLTFRTIFIHNMFSPCSAKRRASDKDLPVISKFRWEKYWRISAGLICVNFWQFWSDKELICWRMICFWRSKKSKLNSSFLNILATKSFWYDIQITNINKKFDPWTVWQDRYGVSS